MNCAQAAKDLDSLIIIQSSCLALGKTLPSTAQDRAKWSWRQTVLMCGSHKLLHDCVGPLFQYSLAARRLPTS